MYGRRVRSHLQSSHQTVHTYQEMRKALVVIMLISSVTLSRAQGDVEYLMEVGAGLGLVSYEGDYNGNITKNMQPMASVMLRRLINPYHGFRVRAGFGKLKGSSADVETYYPGLQETPYTFSHTMVDLCTTYEYNFWPYGTGREYRGAKRLSPFVFGGIGLAYVKAGSDNVFTGGLPIGLGVKYKLADRMNLGVEWGVHFTLSDKLDGSEDPYGIKSSGAFKNTDCYSALQVTLTYSFMAKCRTCHNEDE